MSRNDFEDIERRTDPREGSPSCDTHGTEYALRTPLRPTLAIGLTFVLAAAAGPACRGSEHDRVVAVGQHDCFVCHEPEYVATTEPPHPGLFEVTCGDCHGEDAWVPAVAIRHDWFVLRFAHAEASCTSCHTVGFGEGDTPNTCIGCHQDDYDSARMPPHAGYPTQCTDCHDESAWSPAIFDHSWPLDGAHTVTPCASCHTGDPPRYLGTPRECVGCHQGDYDTSPYPGHDTFPTTCVDCHTTSGWSPAIGGGVHPDGAFQISAGPHEMACLDCHDPALGSSVNGENTDCVGCHEGEHTRAETDGDHREVSGYPSGAAPPNFCLDCHEDGTN